MRLAADARLVATEHGAILHSALGALTLPGRDAGRFVGLVAAPLRDPAGTEAAKAALAAPLRPLLAALLDVMERHGMLVSSADDAVAPRAAQQRFLERCTGTDADAQKRIEQARVLIVGEEAWGAVAARELTAAGIGSVRSCTAERLAHKRADLVLVALPSWALAVRRSVARRVAAARLTALFAAIDGPHATIGPLIADGRPPCAECCRHRLLASAPEPWAEHAVHRALLSENGRGTGAPAAIGFGPGAALLGGAVATQALLLLAGAEAALPPGRLVVQHLPSLETGIHEVVPLPWCDVCGGARAAGRRRTGNRRSKPTGPPAIDWEALASAPDVAAGTAAARGWVDSASGPIVVLRLVHPSRAGLPFAAFATLGAYSDVHASERYTAPYEGSIDNCGGKGATPGEALLGAVCEALERYAAARVTPDGLRLSRLDELDGDVLDPRRLPLYTDEQLARRGFPYVRFDPEAAHLWAAGRWAHDGSSVWIPAPLAHYADLFPDPARPWVQVTSNGLAAGRGYDDAARRALLELVERDAVMTTWLRRLPAPRLLDPEAAGDDVADVLRGLRALGADVRVHLLRSAGIPTVLCCAHGDGEEWPGVTVSSAAHPSLRAAVRGAVMEQGYSGCWVRGIAREGTQLRPERPEQVRTFLDHALLYTDPARAAAATAFLDAGASKPISLAELAETSAAETTLDRCLAGVGAYGARIALVDVTSPDVAATGLAVVRALAEGLQPLHCGHGLERVVAARSGELTACVLNPDPHPMS